MSDERERTRRLTERVLTDDHTGDTAAVFRLDEANDLVPKPLIVRG